MTFSVGTLSNASLTDSAEMSVLLEARPNRNALREKRFPTETRVPVSKCRTNRRLRITAMGRLRNGSGALRRFHWRSLNLCTNTRRVIKLFEKSQPSLVIGSLIKFIFRIRLFESAGQSLPLVYFALCRPIRTASAEDSHYGRSLASGTRSATAGGRDQLRAFQGS